ncbi:hypothetical protein LMG7143_04439 [Ralstonia thomasii]|uniref:toxin co-regulated pilus biosynthesis Q family protein n=1 Tax=Ralstonia thomasii TaxID=3058596 RepID=UPI0028F4DE7F|nr:toxin co-regulated pilus biosynthesis Q family protein [Ralstonia sp. LMG 18095]CAJ0718535.1 hypothetical protein LMG7143_04439 [Ralstonia sp. LMG 18095]
MLRLMRFASLIPLLITCSGAWAGFSIDDPTPRVAHQEDFQGTAGEGNASGVTVNTTPLIGQNQGVSFSLVKGQSLQAQLESWAERAGWSVVWDAPDDWIVPGNKTLGNDFAVAVQGAIEQLHRNGADIQADVWTGNKTIVVHQAGVTE